MLRRSWPMVGLLIVCACGGGQHRLEQVTLATVRAAETAYAVSVEVCDAREKAIIARPGISPADRARDEADLTKVRALCDRIFLAFEEARTVTPLMRELQRMKI